MTANYQMTEELLASRRIATSAAEIHGVLCGQLSADKGQVDIDLSQEILDFEEEVDEVITNLMKMLAEDIEAQIGAGDFAFQPLLPDDDQRLVDRLAALVRWCDGFTAGFAAAWAGVDKDMSPETREVLGDFSRIAQVDSVDDDLTEKENEVNFMEIVEYVRMAAITVYQQNAGTRIAVPGPDTIH